MVEPKGFIAVCKNDTEQECFDLMLFGSIKSWFDKVCQVRKGDIGFLLNLDTNVLYGIFKSETDGAIAIVPEAWKGRFPAQVRVSWKEKYDKLQNARQLLEGLGIYHAKYILTPKEVESITALFETPNGIGVVALRPDIKMPQEQPRFKTEDGHYVRSKSECIIDNWLYNHNLAHAYERRIPIEEDLLCDFYLPIADCYIEYWGMEDFDDYRSRKNRKVVTYQKHGLRLIGLREKDVERLDDMLPRRLVQYLPKGYVLR